MVAQKDIEQYIRTHQLSHSDWCCICQYYRLSESIIREYADIVEWYYICKHQKLSEEFMREFPDKLWFNEIARYQKISPDFVKFIMEYNEYKESSVSSLKNLLKTRRIYNDKYERVIEEYEHKSKIVT